jgi:hypothetical protein
LIPLPKFAAQNDQGVIQALVNINSLSWTLVQIHIRLESLYDIGYPACAHMDLGQKFIHLNLSSHPGQPVLKLFEGKMVCQICQIVYSIPFSRIAGARSQAFSIPWSSSQSASSLSLSLRSSKSQFSRSLTILFLLWNTGYKSEAIAPLSILPAPIAFELVAPGSIRPLSCCASLYGCNRVIDLVSNTCGEHTQLGHFLTLLEQQL